MLLLLLFAFIIFKYSFYLSKRRRLKFNKKCLSLTHTEIDKEGINWYKEQNFTDVYINSFDNTKLHASVLLNPSSTATIIMFHGYFGSNYGRASCIVKRILEQRCINIVFVDQRAFHQSSGHYTTLGYKEKDDVKAWVDYVNNIVPNLPIIIYGFSLGAASVLLSTYQSLNNVKLVIADSGFADAYKEFRYKLKNTIHFDSKLLLDTINFYCKIFGRFNLKKTLVKDSLMNNNIPILYIHGTSDDYVPCEDSYINIKNTKSAYYLEIFEEAAHVRSFNKDPKRYIEILINHIDEVSK